MSTLLFTLLAMCSTLVGGYIAIVARHRIHLLMGLGAGVLLGAVFFDLLPESLSVATTQGWNSRFVLGIVLAGVLFFRSLMASRCGVGTWSFWRWMQLRPSLEVSSLWPFCHRPQPWQSSWALLRASSSIRPPAIYCPRLTGVLQV